MLPVGPHNAQKNAPGGGKPGRNGDDGFGGHSGGANSRRGAESGAADAIPGLTSPFAHLHCRSWFSFLAGASSPEALAAAAAKRGVGALALTDINGIYGVVRFQTACREAGVKPIFGSEVNVEGAPLVLIARDEEGFRNLNLMLTAAHQRSRENPQVRLTELMEHTDGLFCLTGAYGSRLYELIDAHEREAAFRWIRQLHCMFEDRLSIEVATHIHPGDRRRTNTLERLSRETYVPLVATGDVRYARSEDYRRYDLMTCTRLGITIFDDHPERPRNAEAYLRAEEGMRKLIPFPEAFLRAREIAGACTLDLIPGYITPPAASVPPPHSPREYLRGLCWTAFERRYPPEHDTDAYRSTAGAPNSTQGAPSPSHGAPAPLPDDPLREKDDFAAIRRRASAQLEKELGVIGRLELDEFFLVVHEIVDRARELGIRCAGRGSAANSIVAYLLGITGVDPVRNNLLFERFLHAGRKGTPDIDVDFDSERRDEIIAWIEDRFGMEQTAMTATLITYRVRSAIRDTAKAFGWPMETVNRLSKAVPSYSGRDLEEQRERLERITGPSPLLDRLLEMASELAGAPRHLGLHSGGMILSREPLYHFTPVQVSANGVKVVQFDKNDVEALGLVKFDVLGLRMLATLSEADELIKRHESAAGDEPPLDIDELPLDDVRTFNMIRASKTLGVFQIESQGQLHLLAQHQPEDFKDLINEIALFRPGPLQSGMVHPFVRRRRRQEPVTYDHPLLEPILKDTYGVIVFQEQVLEVAHRFANMALEEADEFRRLMSKFRDPGEMEGMRDRFVEGAMRNGVDFDTATKVFENVANFVGYGFCRSHAAAFAKTVYQSAYLKRHHTAAFMAAFMQHRPGMYNQMTLEEEARRFGVPTLLPDINRSGSRFDLERVPAPDGSSGRARRRSDGEAAGSDRGVRGRQADRAPDADRGPSSRAPGGGASDERTVLAIRKPLASIQGVSAEDARAVVWERMTAGPFVSVRDFYERVELSVDQFRHIARSGALDELAGDSRRALWEVGLLNRSVGHPGRRRASTLFDLPPFTEEDVPELPTLTLDERLSWDYETHSAARVHPMTLVRRTLNEYEIRPIASCFELGRVAGGRPLSMGEGGLLGKAFRDGLDVEVRGVPHLGADMQGGRVAGHVAGAGSDIHRNRPRQDSRDGPIVTVAGIAMLRQRPKTANGVFFLTLEDETGFIQTVIYSKVLEALDHVFSQSSLIVRGRLQVMGNWRGLVVSHAWPLGGILGGYEGHAQMGGGRDRMIKRVDGVKTGQLFSD